MPFHNCKTPSDFAIRFVTLHKFVSACCPSVLQPLSDEVDGTFDSIIRRLATHSGFVRMTFMAPAKDDDNRDAVIFDIGVDDRDRLVTYNA
mmetsp:Transcript_17145/g.35983  ORF Transcript_17145/g.35983 Transcript_17145/m.35983 type:complete len:91 (-) Transcript_17145:1095-1367(-)